MSDAIKAKVSEFLQSNGISFAAQYVAETTRDNWKCDEWRVTLSRTGTYEKPATKGRKDITQAYYTGLGLRTPAKGAFVKAKPKAPSAADALHSLLLDGSAVDMSFADWCGDYGYDNDSLKALGIYNACCAIGQELRQFFSREEAETLRDMLQDF